MYIDSQNAFSETQSVVSAVGDVVSTNVYDTASNDVGNGEELVLIARMVAALAGVGSTIQVVLQDSADNATYADVQAGPAVTTALAIVGRSLARFYLPFGLRRYLRVVYRIAGATTTAGTVSSYIVVDAQANTANRSGISAT